MHNTLDIDGAIRYLIQNYHSILAPLSLEKVVVGQHLTAVKLNDASCGVAGTLNTSPSGPCAVSERYFGPFSPGNYAGHQLVELFKSPLKTGSIQSVKMAALNAVSASLLNQSHYTVLADYDPIQSVVSELPLKICMVGAFQSYIKRLETAPHYLNVVELDPTALFPNQKHLFVPYSEAEDVIQMADVVIITGLTLVNGTFAELMKHIHVGQQVILVGPSAGYPPQLLFDAGVTLIGSMRILNPKLVIEIVEQGGSGYHLYRSAAQKICIKND
jgi:uncharacterized protein (DUF4213/DUF364 family)